jgi:hypothetical protein
MTQSEVSNVTLIVLAFLIGGVVLIFITTGLGQAEAKSANRVQIDDRDTLYQLIMYDSLIAHVCDGSVAAGALDNSGSRMYDDWESYKQLWEQHDGSIQGPSGGASLFDSLNQTFPRPDLDCYGTGTTIGAKSIGNMIDPTSKEWRNDQEGQYSRVRFTVNGTPPSEDEDFWVGPCYWFDQAKNSKAIAPRDSAGKGYKGITDVGFFFAHPDHINFYFRFWGIHDGSDRPQGCQTPWRKSNYKSGSFDEIYRGGPAIMVTYILPDGYNEDDYTQNSVSMTGNPFRYEPGEPGPDRAAGARLDWDDSGYITAGADELTSGAVEQDARVRMTYHEIQLCKGMEGYVQTNTGYTVDDGGDFKDEQPPPYDQDNLPGFGDKERWQPENAPKDNSLHPFIVITDMGECS